MSDLLFSPNGCIARWVFFPPGWGSEEPWTSGFSEDQKSALFRHMQLCLACRKAEIEATLKWAALRPRAKTMELIPITYAEIGGINAMAKMDMALPLIEQIMQSSWKVQHNCEKLKGLIANKPKDPEQSI